MRARIVTRAAMAALLGAGGGPGAAAQAASPETEALDPLAVAVVLDWIESPRTARNTVVVVDDSMERANAQGQMILHTHRRTITASGPNHLRLESRGDLVNRDLFFDGSRLTVHDHGLGVYAEIPFSGTTGEMIDMLDRRFGLPVPLADLLHDDRRLILDRVVTGTYVGETQVDGHPCHHVAFTREDIDWQAWFDREDRSVLRRYMVTFKGEPGAPGYIATLVSVGHPESLPEDTFTFVPPEGVRRIEIEPTDASPEASSSE